MAPRSFPGGSDGKESACIAGDPGSIPSSIGKDPSAGKEWGQDEMVGWHHQVNGHEFEQTSGDSERHRSQVCCSPWGRKESDINWTSTPMAPNSLLWSKPETWDFLLSHLLHWKLVTDSNRFSLVITCLLLCTSTSVLVQTPAICYLGYDQMGENKRSWRWRVKWFWPPSSSVRTVCLKS